MNTKKLVLATAISGALAGAGSAYATIKGVPGEALLVPFAASDTSERSEEVHTAVIITAPAAIGKDTVISDYTLPNVLDGNTMYSAPDVMKAHYYVFDEDSKHIYNRTFDLSPNDVYFWSPTDDLLQTYIGYIVFADDVAKSGSAAATFAMAGNAFMLLEDSCDSLGDPDTGLCPDSESTNLTLPVVPMADGIDYCQTRPVNVDGAIACYTGPDANPTGLEHLAITYKNNVVAMLPPTVGTGNRVNHVSPLVAGVRMQAPFSGAAGPSNNPATGLGGLFSTTAVNGLYSPFDGNWTHVFWFSENDTGRSAIPMAFDDDENGVSCPDLPMDRELNAFVYADDDNLVYDLVDAFVNEAGETGEFEDACVQDSVGNCINICGASLFEYPEDEFTQALPGIGIMEYTFLAGPTDTSTAMFFQFMSNIDWDGDYSGEDINVGSDFEVYGGGYQDMTELGKF